MNEEVMEEYIKFLNLYGFDRDQKVTNAAQKILKERQAGRAGEGARAEGSKKQGCQPHGKVQVKSVHFDLKIKEVSPNIPTADRDKKKT